MVGCSGLGWTGGSSPSFRSSVSGDFLDPSYTTAVYATSDANTADLYFSTIPGIGQPGVSMAGVSGSVMHVHMFLKPLAGRTPIDFTAANVTVTHIVVSEGAYGVYGGAGFMLPAGSVGSRSFGGRLEDATLRPTARTAGFVDRMGWNELSGKLSAELDEERAGEIAAWVDALLASDPLVPVATPPARPAPEGTAQEG